MLMVKLIYSQATTVINQPQCDAQIQQSHYVTAELLMGRRLHLDGDILPKRRILCASGYTVAFRRGFVYIICLHGVES